MNILEVLHVVGTLLMWVAGAMLPAAALGVVEGNLVPWLISITATMLLGGGLWLFTPKEVSINPREGLATVGLGWLAVVIAGSIPFVATGTTSGVEAFFESTSGFTTTGATIFPVIEDLPPSILLWRSTTHWLGGMGIIVLGVAILPLIGVGGAQLFRAEVPGVSSDRLTPRIASTARRLWAVYAMFTGLLAGIYLALGMSSFEAINHAMSALATGGFSTRTGSLGAFSEAIQWVTVLFMFIAGTNFALHYRFLTGRLNAWFTDLEWRWYSGVLVTASLVVFVSLLMAGSERGLWELLRHSLFNVAAVHSTTGFATDDFAVWPAVSQVVLIGLMFVGAMGGSTGGGFKMIRAIVVVRHAAGELRKVLHPRAVVVTKLGRKPVKDDVLLNIFAFLGLYVITHGLGAVVIAATGMDFTTAVSASIAAMSSIGPGLGDVGPASNYGDLSTASHLTLSVLMLLGRLEFYTLLVLFIPGTWSKWGGER